jgi:hypothetical protein
MTDQEKFGIGLAAVIAIPLAAVLILNWMEYGTLVSECSTLMHVLDGCSENPPRSAGDPWWLP